MYIITSSNIITATITSKMEWLNKITYSLDIDWLLNDTAVKDALVTSGITEDKFRAIIAEVNNNLVAINMTSFCYDHETVLERALANKTKRISPLPNGYSTDEGWQQLTTNKIALNEKYSEELDVLRKQCRYIQGCPGLTDTHIQKRERTCLVCKEYDELTVTQRTQYNSIKRQLNKIGNGYNTINRPRNEAVLVIARRTYCAPYKKYLHLNSESSEDIILITKNKQYSLKDL